MYAQKDCVGCGEPYQGLGIAWGALIPVAKWGAGYALTQATGGGYAQVGCWDYDYNRAIEEGMCPGTPDAASIARAIERAPQADIDHITRDLMIANGTGPGNRADLLDPVCMSYWVKAFLGGRDCINKSMPQNVPWFKDFVKRYGGLDSVTTPDGITLPGAVVPVARNLTPLLLAAGAFLVLPKLLGK